MDNMSMSLRVWSNLYTKMELGKTEHIENNK